jgi:hypothetical protein
MCMGYKQTNSIININNNKKINYNIHIKSLTIFIELYYNLYIELYNPNLIIIKII